MVGFIVSFLVGIMISVLGVCNFKGNISSLHSYHRDNVSEEDAVPLGKFVGIGAIIIGVSIMIYSVLSALTAIFENQIFIKIGTIIFVVGISVGIIISLIAIKKFNKKIF